MKTLITFITTDTYLAGGSNFAACKNICHDANIMTDNRRDTDELLKKGKGRVNPIGGFIMEAEDGQILFNWRDLAKWIDEKGLKPMA